LSIDMGIEFLMFYW